MKRKPTPFTFDYIKQNFQRLLKNGYNIIRCYDYVLSKDTLSGKTLVNRVDIDFSVKKAERLCLIFNDLGIKASFFVRLHAPEYNPFSFENYRILKYIKESGHEIGYHSEIIDQANIWHEKPEECLRRDLQVLNRMLDITIKGVASHGGLTSYNNLDFWKDNNPLDFGLFYEAYDDQPEFGIFKKSLYVSDSNWNYWKCYRYGDLLENDHRSPAEHSDAGESLIYSLIHSDTYFDRHFYE